MMKLRVWWIPQIPMKAFTVEVASLVEAKLLLDTLADYDLFQYENRVKGDYANAGGLSVFDYEDETNSPDGSWVDWCDDDGRSIDDFELEQLRGIEAGKRFRSMREVASANKRPATR